MCNCIWRTTVEEWTNPPGYVLLRARGTKSMHGRPPHIGANGVSWPPWKNGWKIKKRKHARKSSFLCLCYILRAIGANRCRERCYADHMFIQIYFSMHHFVVKFSLCPAASGHWPPNQNPADALDWPSSVCWRCALLCLSYFLFCKCPADLRAIQRLGAAFVLCLRWTMEKSVSRKHSGRPVSRCRTGATDRSSGLCTRVLHLQSYLPLWLIYVYYSCSAL